MNDRSSAAWIELRDAIQKHGAYASVDFEDPAINATVRLLGGWVALCMKDAATFERRTRREFRRMYRALAVDVRAPQAPRAPGLVGIAGPAQSTRITRAPPRSGDER